jgi:hypothetical protein
MPVNRKKDVVAIIRFLALNPHNLITIEQGKRILPQMAVFWRSRRFCVIFFKRRCFRSFMVGWVESLDSLN